VGSAKANESSDFEIPKNVDFVSVGLKTLENQTLESTQIPVFQSFWSEHFKYEPYC
jgi:hypothetical protein